MNGPSKRTLRIVYKVAIPVSLLLFGLVMWDWLANNSRWMWPLVAVYGWFLLMLLVLLLIGPVKRVNADERRRHLLADEDELPDTISYGDA